MTRFMTVLLLATLAGCSGFKAPQDISPPGPAAATQQLVLFGTTWKYLDDGSDQGTSWRDPAFDDASWASGDAELGYGDGDEVTVTSFGPDPDNKPITTYFRKTFQVNDPAAITDALLRLIADDGAVVYLNGTEITRDNMPEDEVDYLTPAIDAISGFRESTPAVGTFDLSLLVAGANTLAVEVHQANTTSSDMSFAAELLVTTGAPFVVRGPYLQQLTTTSVIVRWRTARAAESRVYFGPLPDLLTSVAGSDFPSMEHEVALTGLRADTSYTYGVGTTVALAAGNDADHQFRTAPPIGSMRNVRIWVIGDSGTADGNSRAVAQGYRNFAGDMPTDVWLMLGDNAYGSGTDAQYQAAMFDIYPDFLRTTAVWPTMGNHDAISVDASARTGPYFDIFTLPIGGEAGGEASGTEAYYSFDYGNVHFVCLDSHNSGRSPGGGMFRWLEADLADTTAEFVIAFWHHPPYSKGTHDSDESADSGGRMRDMRQTFVPLLESMGVDLVLTGHSHSYERSFFLNGHYGESHTLEPSSILDGGNGREGEDGAYVQRQGAGAVYAVAGSSGRVDTDTPLDHPAMVVSLAILGSMVLDIQGTRLTARFLDRNGAELDSFMIVHTN